MTLDLARSLGSGTQRNGDREFLALLEVRQELARFVCRAASFLHPAIMIFSFITQSSNW